MQQNPILRRAALAALALGLLAAGAAAAIPTRVMVRVYSRDAKVVSSKVGGARITVRDVATGEVLAEGLQEGGSGDTEKIMVEPHPRGGTVYGTESAAGFEAGLDLDQPTGVEITAEGPLDNPQATQRASKTLLLVPGKHVLGEGVLLEVHGYRVRFEGPAAEASFTAGEEVEVRVDLTMA